MGGINALNEHLGFPERGRQRQWDDEDYIDYGSEILRLNGPGSLTPKNFSLLSAHRLGPSLKAIRTRFGWSKFKRLATENYHRQTVQQMQRQSEISDYYRRRFPETGTAVSGHEQEQHWALAKLLDYYRLPSTEILPDRLTHQTVHSVMTTIKQAKAHTTMGEIEVTAIMLDIFDTLWPQPSTRHLPLLAGLQPQQRNKLGNTVQ